MSSKVVHLTLLMSNEDGTVVVTESDVMHDCVSEIKSLIEENEL